MTDIDPFAGTDSLPSLSFKDSVAGKFKYELEVIGSPTLVQGKDFDTDEPAVWTNKDGTTSPKMCAVVPVKILSGPRDVGEERSIWATKPSALFSALADAQRDAKAKFAVGGTLTLAHTDDAAPKNPRHNKIKQYTAVYSAPDAFATSEAASEAPF